MRVFLTNIYKFLFFFIAIPFFIDFSSLNFLILEVDQGLFFLENSPSIPFPIGGVAVFLIVIVGFICSVLYPQYFRCAFSVKQLFLFYIFVIFPLFLYAFFIADLSFPRILQLLLPVNFLSMLSLPVVEKDRRSVIQWYFFGAIIFFFLHFISIWINAKSILDVNEWAEFSSFFGILIYQSLVTYPGVLSLNLFLLFSFLYKLVLEGKGYIGLKFFIYFSVIFLLLYLLAASGRRAFLVEFISFFLIVSFLSVLYVLYNNTLRKNAIFPVFLIFLLVFLFFYIYFNTPLSSRVLLSMEKNELDSGRVEILNKALFFYLDNLNIFLFGGGDGEYPGFHNYILDQIYRVGLIGLFFVYASMAFVIKRFVYFNDVYVVYAYPRFVFIMVIFSSLFWQSMINASISQPYYFINFLIVSIFSYFFVFTVKIKI